MNATTRSFLEEVDRQINDAILIGGTRGRNIVRQLADQLADCQIHAIDSKVDPAEVELSTEQWDKLARSARMQAAFCEESW